MKRILLIALCSAAFGSSAWAACTPPNPPSAIPDGKSSTKDQMMAAKKDVDQYKKDVEAYVSCETNTSRAESAQADLERTANKFNAAVRAFKAANADG
jgi:hypothetical protein